MLDERIMGRAFVRGGLGILALVFCSATVAVPIHDQLRVQSDGEVTITLLRSSAQYHSDIYLEMPHAAPRLLFSSKQPEGAMMSLGHFAAGTLLNLCIHVRDTGDTFFMGDGARNEDGLRHAMLLPQTHAGAVLVQFEDMLHGGDNDFDDVQFTVSNARTLGSVVVPESGATWLLLGVGLFSVVAWARWNCSSTVRSRN